MSVLSEQDCRRIYHVKYKPHGATHRGHLVVDFMEWAALLMFIAFLVTNQERARELFTYVYSFLGQ